MSDARTLLHACRAAICPGYLDYFTCFSNGHVFICALQHVKGCWIEKGYYRWHHAKAHPASSLQATHQCIQGRSDSLPGNSSFNYHSVKRGKEQTCAASYVSGLMDISSNRNQVFSGYAKLTLCPTYDLQDRQDKLKLQVQNKTRTTASKNRWLTPFEGQNETSDLSKVPFLYLMLCSWQDWAVKSTCEPTCLIFNAWLVVFGNTKSTQNELKLKNQHPVGKQLSQ